MTGQPKTLVIVNRKAARGAKVWPVVKEHLQQGGLVFDSHITRNAGDATGVARAALRDGTRLIAVVGGDGTLSEAAEGFFGFESDGRPALVSQDASIAIIPAGTGDDFARSMTGRRESVSRWVSAVLDYAVLGNAGRSRRVDVMHGRIGPERRNITSINMASVGVGAEIAARVGNQGELIRRLPGEVRFLAGAVPSLLKWKGRQVQISLDGEQAFECSTNMIALANNRFAGGGMMFSPEAKPDDGLIDVLVARDFGRAGILRELGRIHRGEHVRNPKIQITRVRSIRIESASPEEPLQVETDGNTRGETPAEFQILPGALSVVC